MAPPMAFSFHVLDVAWIGVVDRSDEPLNDSRYLHPLTGEDRDPKPEGWRSVYCRVAHRKSSLQRHSLCL